MYFSNNIGPNSHLQLIYINALGEKYKHFLFRPWFVNSDFTSDLHITTVLYLQRMICQTLSWLIFPISFVVVKNVTTEGDCYIQHISTITLSIDIVLYQVLFIKFNLKLFLLYRCNSSEKVHALIVLYLY